MIIMIVTMLATMIFLYDHDDYHQIDNMDLSVIMMIITRLTTWIAFHDHDEYDQIDKLGLSTLS